MPDRAFALGVGRVGRDVYFRVGESAARFDAKKTSVEYLGERLGGSVPAILEVLARNGLSSEMIAGVGEQPWAADIVLGGLALKGLVARPIPLVRSPESVILHDQDDALVDMLVESEVPALSMLSAADVDDIDLPAPPGLVVFDTRHPDAARVLAKKARDGALLTFADPGALGAEPARARATLSALFEANIVFASRGSLEGLSAGQGVAAVAARLLARSAIAVIATEVDGSCSLFDRRGVHRIRTPVVRRVGTSVGAGDLCRGFTLLKLSEILLSGRNVESTDVAEALIHGLAASAWRLEDSNLFYAVPEQSHLVTYVQRTRAANTDGQWEAALQ